MTINELVLKAIEGHPNLHNNLNHYATSGDKSYAELIEFDLKIIKQQYGNVIYNQFNHIYNGIKEVNNNEEYRH